jgi:hypothetical protein
VSLASKAVFEHGTFAAIVVSALAAWTACGSKSSLKAKGTVDAGAGGGRATDGAIVDGADGAADAPAIDAPVADSAPDVPQACGDAVCRSGQTCALIGGGAQPPCDPPLDAGTCPSYLVLVASCGGYGPPSRQPGCTTPPDTPKCYDLPDGCDDFCSCVCGLPKNWGCYPGPGYLFCSRP